MYSNPPCTINNIHIKHIVQSCMLVAGIYTLDELHGLVLQGLAALRVYREQADKEVTAAKSA